MRWNEEKAAASRLFPACMHLSPNFPVQGFPAG